MSFFVKYSDVAVGAKESFEISASQSLPESNIGLLKLDNVDYKRYDIPFELNSMVLDGNSVFLPTDGSAEIGFISESMSNGNADFESPIVFELISSELFTSPGLSIVFDEKKNIYPTHMRVSWKSNDEILAESDFFPSGATFFCEKRVEFYNKIEIQFYSLNVPFNRLRVNRIDHGIEMIFNSDELRGAKIIQEIDPISTNVPINTFDFSINSQKDIELFFQSKQPLELITDGQKKSVTFIKSAKRKSKNIWDIQSEDYIGIMDSVSFKGGMYFAKNAIELLDEIFLTAKVPYELEDNFQGKVVDGYIPYTTCREALMQVVFAIGAVADTSNSDKVKIFSAKNVETQMLPKNRILQGQSFEDETRVTAVEIFAHSYAETDETFVVYEAEKSGAGESILVLFSEPLHDISIAGGEIIESGANYAKINAELNCILSGKKYQHSKYVRRKDNPLVLYSDIENVLTIENSTLVSGRNIDSVLEMCYDYLTRAEKTTLKIVDGKNDMSTNVGDLISFETEYSGTKTGRIVRQSFSLAGGIFLKDSVVR